MIARWRGRRGPWTRSRGRRIARRAGSARRGWRGCSRGRCGCRPRRGARGGTMIGRDREPHSRAFIMHTPSCVYLLCHVQRGPNVNTKSYFWQGLLVPLGRLHRHLAWSAQWRRCGREGGPVGGSGSPAPFGPPPLSSPIAMQILEFSSRPQACCEPVRRQKARSAQDERGTGEKQKIWRVQRLLTRTRFERARFPMTVGCGRIHHLNGTP